MKSLKNQQGASAAAIIFGIFAVVLIGKLLYATLPAYVDDRSLNSVIQQKLDAAGSENADAVMAQIQNQLRMNFSDTVASDVIKVQSSAPGNIVLVKDYEVRSNLVGHVDVVNHFQKEFRQNQ